jgi:hypothetical protein
VRIITRFVDARSNEIPAELVAAKFSTLKGMIQCRVISVEYEQGFIAPGEPEAINLTLEVIGWSW